VSRVISFIDFISCHFNKIFTDVDYMYQNCLLSKTKQKNYYYSYCFLGIQGERLVGCS